LAAEQTLIPAAACFHICYSDERLRMHRNQRNNSQSGRTNQSRQSRFKITCVASSPALVSTGLKPSRGK
jgi:hypothetical protein